MLRECVVKAHGQDSTKQIGKLRRMVGEMICKLQIRKVFIKLRSPRTPDRQLSSVLDVDHRHQKQNMVVRGIFREGRPKESDRCEP